jgi:hypothetical protein
MFSLPQDIIAVIAAFAPLFSDRVWWHAQVLMIGAILTPGKRTVSQALRVMELSQEEHFTNYHRVLNRAVWNALQGRMIKQVRRWLPNRLLVLVVDGGFAAVSLALSCGQINTIMVSRLRWDASLYHPPQPQPSGKRGPKPKKGRRQRRLKTWANRSDTPWEEHEISWYGGKLNRKANSKMRPSSAPILMPLHCRSLSGF